ncbi:hypothetical protein BCR34DRAFT_115657 [Clohesyomyces aquaticus]|uniref:Uncharacterized protein n=1 Tax=Clohesyomyces aquaticus TaxID=1231657 RepID=A0A1Y1YQE4_9PLEO|nr:hypothetical protein BCR34DRAFT_115657 [Clohesyomyces aquaticus]
MAQPPYRVPNTTQNQTQGETGEEASRWQSDTWAQAHSPPDYILPAGQYQYPYDRQPQNPPPASASNIPNTLFGTAQSYPGPQTKEPWGWKNVRPFGNPPLQTSPDKGHNSDGNNPKASSKGNFAGPSQELDHALAKSPWSGHRLPNPMAEPYYPQTPALQHPQSAVTDTPGDVNDISVGAGNQFPFQPQTASILKPFLRPPPGLSPRPKYPPHLTYPRSTPHSVFLQDAEAPAPTTDLFGKSFLWTNITTEETYVRTLWQRKKEKDFIREETQK